jgi:hypothetical protein
VAFSLLFLRQATDKKRWAAAEMRKFRKSEGLTACLAH